MEIEQTFDYSFDFVFRLMKDIEHAIQHPAGQHFVIHHFKKTQGLSYPDPALAAAAALEELVRMSARHIVAGQIPIKVEMRMLVGNGQAETVQSWSNFEEASL